VVAFLLLLLSFEDETGRNDFCDDDDVEQEVDDDDDDDDDDGVDALIITHVFYLSKFDECSAVKSAHFFAFFANCDSISCEKASRGADEYFSKEPLKNSIVRIQTQNTNHTLKVVV
jgi:hypothetical protein